MVPGSKRSRKANAREFFRAAKPDRPMVARYFSTTLYRAGNARPYRIKRRYSRIPGIRDKVFENFFQKGLAFSLDCLYNIDL